MPVYSYSGEEALRLSQSNPAARWYKAGADPHDPEGLLAFQRLKRPVFLPCLSPGFLIDPEDRIFAVGSCFARGIEKALVEHGLRVESVTSEFEDSREDCRAGTPLGITNKYNTFSILNDLSWALKPGYQYPEKALVHLDASHVVDPHTNPALSFVDRDRTLERRRILTHLTRRIASCRIVIVTLGLIEVWQDKETGLYINMTPTPEMLAVTGKGRYAFHVTGYESNRTNLEEIHRVLTHHGHPDVRIVITVSPVPLMSTFSERDVVLANTFSKSMLRTVAEDFAANKPNVDYFPSFEIVMNSDPSLAWTEDGRHVQGALTRQIMDFFTSVYIHPANETDRDRPPSFDGAHPGQPRRTEVKHDTDTRNERGLLARQNTTHPQLAEQRDRWERRHTVDIRGDTPPMQSNREHQSQNIVSMVHANRWALEHNTIPLPVCPNPIFVVGCPRSGTSVLAHSLARHSRLWLGQESDFMAPLARSARELHAFATRRGRYQWLSGQEVSVEEFLRYIGTGVNALFTQRSGGLRWVEQTPQYTLSLSDIICMHPGARFIHIVRDARDVVLSMTRSGFDIAWARDFNEACRTWVRFVEAALAFEEENPRLILRVQHEALVKERTEGFTRILKFVGLPYEASVAELMLAERMNSSFQGPEQARPRWEEVFSQPQQGFLLELCGQLLTRLGYDTGAARVRKGPSSLKSRDDVQVRQTGEERMGLGGFAVGIPLAESKPSDRSDSMAEMHLLEKKVAFLTGRVETASGKRCQVSEQKTCVVADKQGRSRCRHREAGRNEIPRNVDRCEKIISERYRFIWIFVPKVAGRSVKRILIERYEGYSVELGFKELLEAKPEYGEYFKFAFCRNPWSRIVSCYVNKIDTDDSKNLNACVVPYAGLYPHMPFPDFVTWLLTDKGGDLHKNANRHWVSQHLFVTDKENKIFVDYVGHVERIQEDFDLITDMIGMPRAQVPHLGATKNPEEPDTLRYRSFFDNETKQKLGMRYKEDIQLFRYSF